MSQKSPIITFFVSKVAEYNCFVSKVTEYNFFCLNSPIKTDFVPNITEHSCVCLPLPLVSFSAFCCRRTLLVLRGGSQWGTHQQPVYIVEIGEFSCAAIRAGANACPAVRRHVLVLLRRVTPVPTMKPRGGLQRDMRWDGTAGHAPGNATADLF